jgi:large subunit ribosomal protein L22
MEVKAVSKDVPGAPRKVRLILDQLRGRRVAEAQAFLQFVPMPVARAVSKTVASAASNAENNYNMDPDDLVIVAAFAGEGRKLRRFRPRSRGRASRILKKSSHITIVVDERED